MCWHPLLVDPGTSSDCSNPLVRTLLAFVAARAEEDQSAARTASPANESMLDVCELAERLLELAVDRCAPDSPCRLSLHQVRTLVEVARLTSITQTSIPNG